MLFVPPKMVSHHYYDCIGINRIGSTGLAQIRYTVVVNIQICLKELL